VLSLLGFHRLTEITFLEKNHGRQKIKNASTIGENKLNKIKKQSAIGKKQIRYRQKKVQTMQTYKKKQLELFYSNAIHLYHPSKPFDLSKQIIHPNHVGYDTYALRLLLFLHKRLCMQWGSAPPPRTSLTPLR